ncbi:hypothetical protein [Thermus tengchongensis]|uniref:Uncharacterized protein n=1 Tax=Thermus tengchongensis TaxID=1214928 RepID=A0ABY2K8L3_9DEIN|nr:hypothetical protein [Thermus tengchongensis]TFU17587.1 hypothetical protein E0489_02065 [Thermus tengchongensis]
MPKNLTPQDQWETQFEVPLPGEPRNIGPLETLFQRLLNRTERLRSRIGDLLGLPWDATPPDTLAGLHQRVGTLEAAQGGTTLQAHRSAPVLDHPDGSVTLPKLGAGLGYGSSPYLDPIAHYQATGQELRLEVGQVAAVAVNNVTTQPLRMAVGPDDVYEFVWVQQRGYVSGSGGISLLLANNTTYTDAFRETSIYSGYSGSPICGGGLRGGFVISATPDSVASGVISVPSRSMIRYGGEVGFSDVNFQPMKVVSTTFWTNNSIQWTSMGTLSFPYTALGVFLVRRIR